MTAFRYKDQVANEKVRAARVRVTRLRPYFSHAVYGLVLVESELCPTMAVDEWWRLYYNPEFVHECTVDELTTVELHEVSHVVREHCKRAREMGVAPVFAHLVNIAQDMAVNATIRQEQKALPADKLADLPETKDPEVLAKIPRELRGPWFPEQIDMPEGLPWEAYFDKMMSMVEFVELVPTHDCGSGSHGYLKPWEIPAPRISGMDGLEEADREDVIRITAQEILSHAKGHPSTVPGEWIEWANDTLRPVPIPWDVVLGGHLRGCIGARVGEVDYSYALPSRLAQSIPDAVFPAMVAPEPTIVFIGDTSASMNVEHDLALVRGTVTDLCHQMNVSLTFLAVDAAVHDGPQVVASGDEIRIAGRGGTSMTVGIEYAVGEMRPRPDVIIVATDCETDWPEVQPASPVIVCAIGAIEHWIAQIPDWAKIVRVEAAS